MDGSESKPEPVAAPQSGTSSISIEDVGHSYAGRREQVEALQGIDLTVTDGEFVALLGPSGCGKSTLLLLVAGLMQPTTGTIRIGGKEIREPYTELGFVFQEATLLEWRTALRNILIQAEARGLDRQAAKERAVRLMKSTNIAGFEDAYPNELSGGMKQRVALCRALLHEPQLLLMDEPFGALDALTREQMAVDLQHLWLTDRKTVLFVTHDIAEAIFLADRVVVLSQRPGRILGIVDIPLPRPRTPVASEEATELQETIRDMLRADGVLDE